MTSVLCDNPRPCRYGDNCRFAHGLEEARLFREAKHLQVGCRLCQCAPSGCLVAHADINSPMVPLHQNSSPFTTTAAQESRGAGRGTAMVRSLSSGDAGSYRGQQQQQTQAQAQAQQQQTPGSSFKTVLCFHFESRGACRFGDTCNFAHGEAELRRR